MHDIILRQHDAAGKLDARGFVLGAAGVLLRLAAAQIILNALISLTGMELLRLALYLYAAWLLFLFLRRAVAGYVYTLSEETLSLERRFGDSTISVVEIPLESIAAMRPVRMGERLRTAYRDVMIIDPAARPTARVRAAFVLSLISARLARAVAGRNVEHVIGHVIVYDHGCIRRACVFRPNEEMCRALEERLRERFGFDERMTHAKVRTLYSRALERAFPALYPYVDPLVSPEKVKWAREQMDSRKAQRAEKKAAKNAAKKAAQKKANAKDKTNKPVGSGDKPRTEQPRRRRKQG